MYPAFLKMSLLKQLQSSKVGLCNRPLVVWPLSR